MWISCPELTKGEMEQNDICNIDRSFSVNEINALLEFVREEDTVVFKNFTDIAKSSRALLRILETLHDKNVNILCLSGNVELFKNEYVYTVAINMIATAAQFEQKREAGGPRKIIDDEKLIDLFNKHLKHEIKVEEIAKEMNISRSKVYRRAKELGLY